MRTKCGWVWYEWADQQSIARWETEGGSYDPWTGDALERDNIIKKGFKRLSKKASNAGIVRTWTRSFTRAAGRATSLAGSRSSHTRMLTELVWAVTRLGQADGAGLDLFTVNNNCTMRTWSGSLTIKRGLS
jgi:hypothetical protein